MSAARLLKEARAAGLSLSVSPAGKLACRGPAETVERLKPALSEHRDALLDELRGESAYDPIPLQRDANRRNANAVVHEAEASVFAHEHSPVVMTVPSGDDPLDTAAELIRLARSNAVPGRIYRFRLTDGREADRRNADAARSGSTASYCRCGQFAPLAWPDHDGRPVWICDECAPTRGRA